MNLTPRQLQIARMIADGEKCVSIAIHFGISPKTVWDALSRIYAKTGARGIALLVRWLIRNGLIEP